jgi:hypothetical protein
VQTTCSTLPNTHFLRKAILFLLVLASTFIWIQTDKAAQNRREFAASQNENDDLQFSTAGTLDRDHNFPCGPARGRFAGGVCSS